MPKVILVLLDACGFEAASSYMGCLEQLTEQNLCAKYKLTGQLPSTSRPMYETVLTGVLSSVHGTVTNRYRGKGYSENLFSLCRKNGLTTAAAAYNWISELYNEKGAFDLAAQRFQLETGEAIQNGIFYSEDCYPDSHLYADAEFLRKQCRPDFLLIHPMNIDDAGHKKGSESAEYRYAVMKNSELISELLPAWRADGYDVVVTADHGMDSHGMHGGTLALHREIPLYILSSQAEPGDYSSQPITQLAVAPLLCRLLGIDPGELMIQPEIRGIN